MSKYGGESSAPEDAELLRWGWNTTQISQLRQLPSDVQRDVLNEYIRQMMEDSMSNATDF